MRGEGEWEERVRGRGGGETGWIPSSEMDVDTKYQRESCHIRDFATRGSRKCSGLFIAFHHMLSLDRLQNRIF